jgi:hypothetical protein
MKEFVMKHKTTFLTAVAAVILVCVTVVWNQQKAGTTASQAQKLATLKDLRDNGLLSEAEYQAKVHQITGDAPAPQPAPAASSNAPAAAPETGDSAPPQTQLQTLKDLHDHGLLTDDEYQSKVQALTGGNGSERMAPGRTNDPAGAPAPPLINDAVRTVPIGDPDPQLRMVAGTLQVPADWKFGGFIVRNFGCHGDGAKVQYSAQSPDGLLAVQTYPSFVWDNTGEPPMRTNLQGRILGPWPAPAGGCPPADISSAAEFLERVVVPNLRPYAALVQIGPLPAQGQELLQNRLATLREGAERQAAQFRQMGWIKRANNPDEHMLDGAIAYLRYSINGHEVDEAVRAVVHCARVWVPGNYVSTPSVKIHCNSWQVFAERAPSGMLIQTSPRLLAIESSYRVNPQWDYTMGQIARQQSEQMMAISNATFQAQQKAAQDFTNTLTQKSIDFNAQQQRQFNQHEGYMALQGAKSDANLAQFYGHENAMADAAHRTQVFALDQNAFIDKRTGTEYDLPTANKRAFIGSDGIVYGSTGPANPISTVPGITISEMPMR